MTSHDREGGSTSGGDPAPPPVRPGFAHLYQPLEIGNFTVANRIVMPTHGTRLPEERELRYLRERAQGGTGLFGIQASGGVTSYGVGYAPFRDVAAWDERSPTPTTPAGIAYYDGITIPYLGRRAKVIHEEGARCFAQVFHYGAAPHGLPLSPTLGPSNVPDPYDSIVPHSLTEEEIDEVITVFAHGIRRASNAGVDAAEIHAAHGYLINEFLSPYFNRRDDQWGGPIENRVRIVKEIIERARTMVGGDYPIGIRIGVDGDGHQRGITIDDLAQVGRLLADSVAYISVSGGNYAGFGGRDDLAYVSPWLREPGFNVPAAQAVKAAVPKMPVIVTGRINDLSLAEAILAEGSADLIGMVRALIADPHLPAKVAVGRDAEIRMCLGLSECHHIGAHRGPVTCAVNAAAGREAELEPVPATHRKTVAVLGAGPAGMEAARMAALRGHSVYLADAKREIGGTIRLLAQDPNRRNLLDHAAYYESELGRLTVELLLGTTVTADELVEFAPDVLVVATGGRATVPAVPGIAGPHVVTAIQVLSGQASLSERVLVVGGFESHLAGPTVAEFAADQGRSVELISEHADFAKDAEDGTRFALIKRLAQKGVAFSSLHRLVDTEGDGATVANTLTGARRPLPSTTVVLACGLVPNDELVKDLRGRLPEVHVIGDALAPRRLMHATLEGARVGRAI